MLFSDKTRCFCIKSFHPRKRTKAVHLSQPPVTAYQHTRSQITEENRPLLLSVSERKLRSDLRLYPYPPVSTSSGSLGDHSDTSTVSILAFSQGIMSASPAFVKVSRQFCLQIPTVFPFFSMHTAGIRLQRLLYTKKNIIMNPTMV